MARALYLRGRAKRAVGRTAEAIADLNSAIWFRQLPEREQKAAVAERQKAYQSSGISAPAPSPTTPAATVAPAARQVVTAPPTRSTQPLQHKVARPILSSSRLPEGQRRSAPTPAASSLRTVTTRAAPASAPIIQHQSTARQQAPAWSQVVTGTLPPAKPSPLNKRPTKSAVTTAAVPRFRQVTVPARPAAKKVAASAPTPVKTWSPLTQQFSAPPQSQSVPPRQAAVRPSSVSKAPARPVEITAPHTKPRAQPAPQPTAKPALESAKIEEPAQPPASIANIGSLLFGGSATPKTDAVSAADQLQAERRARIQAHNKQFETR